MGYDADAKRLGVNAGDTVTLIVPGGGLTGDTGQTRLRALHLSGVDETGTELDQGVALVRLELASRRLMPPETSTMLSGHGWIKSRTLNSYSVG